MASTVLKCSACNIVINEVLAFMHNKMNVMDEEGLVQICRTAFSTDDIFEAKKLLFDAVPIRKIKKRKKESKSTRDLEDVIELLKHIDATDPERLPIFVARDLHKLPPVTFDHVDVTRLLRDINLLKDELKTIKSTYVTKTQLKDTIECSREKSLNYINTKRGAYALNSYSSVMSQRPLLLSVVRVKSARIYHLSRPHAQRWNRPFKDIRRDKEMRPLRFRHTQLLINVLSHLFPNLRKRPR
ncbi:uncharacterized protein LOC123693079 [Colias croceus]|uniref:uncharacterized protein LOC123693079 n=1 Tax=Colias crocea TaxID=72248 RepID=UPI001E27D012|nr:uncharacterized protein LOC123693079 [Colias croceus]